MTTTAWVLTVGWLLALASAWCGYRYLRPGRSDCWQSLRGKVVRAYGLVSLAALPAALVQCLGMIEGVPPGAGLVVLPVAWFVLMGGAVGQAGFEATVDAVMGARESTLLDQVPYYALWVGVVVGGAMMWVLRRWRIGGGEGEEERVIGVGVAVAVAVNAFAGLSWPWWGT